MSEKIAQQTLESILCATKVVVQYFTVEHPIEADARRFHHEMCKLKTALNAFYESAMSAIDTSQSPTTDPVGGLSAEKRNVVEPH